MEIVSLEIIPLLIGDIAGPHHPFILVILLPKWNHMLDSISVLLAAFILHPLCVGLLNDSGMLLFDDDAWAEDWHRIICIMLVRSDATSLPTPCHCISIVVPTVIVVRSSILLAPLSIKSWTIETSYVESLSSSQTFEVLNMEERGGSRTIPWASEYDYVGAGYCLY